MAAFSAKAAFLHAAERYAQVAKQPAVDPHGPDLEPGSDPVRLRAWREKPETVQMPGAGGESIVEVLDRAWPAFQRACAGLGADDTLLVVAHDAVNRVILCRIFGLPLSRLWTFRQAPTTINLLEGPSAEALEVVRLNDCNHHTALFGEAVHRAL